MKKLSAICILSLLIPFSACSNDNDEKSPADTTPKPQWHLEWSDDFSNGELDTSVWSRTTTGTPDWKKYQSDDERCCLLRDGKLVLRGIVNDNTEKDPRPYLCGGVWSKGLRAFGPGAIMVRAKLGAGAQGAWPAIWLMPFDETTGWPECGEIDIMERLNHEGQVYQTVHSNYTQNLGNRTDPISSLTTRIDPDTYHTYEVQIWEDEVIFCIDGKRTHTYPKKNGGADGQFPFYKEWYLIMDMQLGGSWVGSISPDQLPVEMEIDWVKYFKYY